MLFQCNTRNKDSIPHICRVQSWGIWSIQIRLLEVNQNWKWTINNDVSSRRRLAVSNPIDWLTKRHHRSHFPVQFPNTLHLSIYSSINPISQGKEDLFFTIVCPLRYPIKDGRIIQRTMLSFTIIPVSLNVSRNNCLCLNRMLKLRQLWKLINRRKYRKLIARFKPKKTLLCSQLRNFVQPDSRLRIHWTNSWLL